MMGYLSFSSNPSIHPFIILHVNYTHRVMVGNACTGLYRMPVYGRARTPFTMVILEPNGPRCMFLDFVRKHANSFQKGSQSDSKPETSCCQANNNNGINNNDNNKILFLFVSGIERRQRDSDNSNMQ